jgi:uncharacterized protein (DUF362 family)
MAKSKVAVLKVKPETILDDIVRLSELGGLADALELRSTTILRDNASSAFPFPSANTTPWQLEGSILALRRAGLTDISCVQNKAVAREFKAGDPNGYQPIFRRYQIPVVRDLSPQHMKWLEYRPRAKLHVLHHIFPDGIRLPAYFFGKNMLHLPTVKCHVETSLSGAMKNAFGGLLNGKRQYTRSWIHRALVDLLAIQQEIHSGLFAVMDGTTAGNGPGPRGLIPVIKGYMLASADQVAIDAVAAKMMGFDPLSLEFIRVAHDDGLGIGDPAQIEVVGDDISSQNWGFSVGEAGQLSDVIWLGPLKRMHELLFQTPLTDLFSVGAELYYEHYRRPYRDNALFESWQAETQWGKLFGKYARGLPLPVASEIPVAGQEGALGIASKRTRERT